MSSVSVLPDGRIVSESEDDTVRVWNSSSYHCDHIYNKMNNNDKSAIDNIMSLVISDNNNSYCPLPLSDVLSYINNYDGDKSDDEKRVKYNNNNNIIAVGTNKGRVQIITITE